MPAPNHHLSTAKLPPDLHATVRALIAERGIGKASMVLQTTDTTLQKLINGTGLTVRARDRIEARAREVTKTTATVQAGRIESADGQTTATFFSAHVEVSGPGAADAIGAVLARAVGFGR